MRLALVKRRSQPPRQALWFRAWASSDLPMAPGACIRMFSWRSTKRPVARSKVCWRYSGASTLASKPSRVVSSSKSAAVEPEGELLL